MRALLRNKFLPFCLILIGVNLNLVAGVQAQDVSANIPGLVIGLGHTKLYNPQLGYPPNSAQFRGGDLGAPSGVGFTWFALTFPGTNWDASKYTRLPPGLVLALRHSQNQANMQILAFNQYDAVNGPQQFPGFIKRFGGDIGAPAGVGFVWYESLETGNIDWSVIDRLPKGTIMGLRHTRNLGGVLGGLPPLGSREGLKIMWSGKYACTINATGPVQGPPTQPAPCDCISSNVNPPPGFIRVGNYDLGAPSGTGFCWYEKK
jgi:hypothetical protein